VDDELVQLKRKMGMLPPEEPPRAQPVRVEAPPAQGAALEAAEQEELARALAELDAEQHEPLRLKRE
jgi:phage shock protein A